MDPFKDFLDKYLSTSTQRILLLTSVYLIIGFVLYAYIYIIISLGVVALALWYAYDYIDRSTASKIDPTEKYVFITGCDSGFGLDSAKTIRDLGFYVIAGCYDVNSPGAKELKGRPWVKKIEVVHLDVTSEASVQTALEEVKAICCDQGLWAVINNAGVNNMGPAELLPMTSYHHTAEVNLFGPVRVNKHFLPLIRLAQGRIVNVTSERAFNHWANSASYCITKAGLEAYSNCLRREMRQHKVKVITVVPGEFAPATAICNQRINDCLKEAVLSEHCKLSPADQKAYPLKSIEDIFKCLEPGVKAKLGNISMEPVIQAFADAIMREDPKDTYLVHGLERQYLDPHIVSARLRPFLPSCMMEPVESALFWILL